MKTLTDVLQLDRPLLGFDLETTGTNFKTARILEVGLEIMKPETPTKEYRTLVKPVDEHGNQVPIPPAASKIHGITDDMVADAPTFRQLAPNFFRGFTNADFAGYNVRFDLRIIAAEFARCNIPWSYQDAFILDAFRLWQVLHTRSLEDAYRMWVLGQGVPVPSDVPTAEDIAATFGDGKAHTALHDVKWSTRTLAGQIDFMREHRPDLGEPTVERLHQLCWPGWFDSEGKLSWQDGRLCYAFGEHRGVPITEAPWSYGVWLIKKDFSDVVKDAVRRALNGEELPAPAHLRDLEGEDDE